MDKWMWWAVMVFGLQRDFNEAGFLWSPALALVERGGGCGDR